MKSTLTTKDYLKTMLRYAMGGSVPPYQVIREVENHMAETDGVLNLCDLAEKFFEKPEFHRAGELPLSDNDDSNQTSDGEMK